MKRTRAFVLILFAAALLLVAAPPAEAYHWHYFHPVWGLGLWPHLVGPLYPPVIYVPPPVVVIQPQPQQPPAYTQRPPEQPPQQIVWYWCTEPQGFFPHVRECKGNAWLKVLPETAPPQQR